MEMTTKIFKITFKPVEKLSDMKFESSFSLVIKDVPSYVFANFFTNENDIENRMLEVTNLLFPETGGLEKIEEISSIDIKDTDRIIFFRDIDPKTDLKVKIAMGELDFKKNPLKKKDMRGMNLSGLVWDGLNGPPISLKESDLTNVSFKKSTLVGIDFRSASMMGSDFSGSTVSTSVYSWANLNNSNLSMAEFDGCAFIEANLSGVNAEGSDFSKSDFRSANLSGGNFQRCSFDGAYLEKTILRGGDFRGCSFTGTGLRNVDLDGAIFDDGALKHFHPLSTYTGIPKYVDSEKKENNDKDREEKLIQLMSTFSVLVENRKKFEDLPHAKEFFDESLKVLTEEVKKILCVGEEKK